MFPMALLQTCPLTLGGRPNSQVFFTSLVLCLHEEERGGEERGGEERGGEERGGEERGGEERGGEGRGER